MKHCVDAQTETEKS